MTQEEERDVRERQASALLRTLGQDRPGGRLKIYLGFAPGVGKTFAMLNGAREMQQQGTAMLVGLVETHGRSETERLLDGLDVMPRRRIDYNGQVLEEFDLDEALRIHPPLILVDELAHTNVPGSRHRRRYQDIEELLAAGIDVHTTLNIQHLESLNDLVLQITGVRVRETVPDHFIDDAHEIVFVDLPPASLIERLRQGKVYQSEYAASALDAFFVPANLTALRELALREVMERVDANLREQLQARALGHGYVIHERLLVLVSTNSNHDYLVRHGRQIADRRRIPWLVAWVDTGRVQTAAAKERLHATFSLARELGAQTQVLHGTTTLEAVVPFIAAQAIGSVLVGAGTRHRFQPWRKRLYRQLIETALPLEVCVIRPGQLGETAGAIREVRVERPGQARAYGTAAVAVLAATLFAVTLERWTANSNLVLVYVLAVISTGLRFGSRPALVASVLSFLSFNFFLTEPRYTFAVERQEELATLIFLFLIALVCGPMASRIRRQFALLNEANRYSEAMRNLGQALTVVENLDALWRETAAQFTAILQRESIVAVFTEPAAPVLLPVPSQALSVVDTAALDWAQQHGAAAGHQTDTLSSAAWTVFPVRGDERSIACVLLRAKPDGAGMSPQDLDLIRSMLRQVADTWRRIHLVRDLETERVRTEVEKLRSALLSSISHDLKSPLSAMIGAAESLRLLQGQLDAADREELLDTILQESHRLDSYIQNLLDMTRLGYGTLRIERDWVSIADIVGSALARLRRYHADVVVETNFEGSAPVLHVHAALVEQALFNILENAAKFTPADQAILVKVATRGSTCVIEVEDRGPGIPESLRDRIFDMFYVVSDGDQKRHGTGMGLAICRGMLAAHQGSVRAEPGTGGRGTRMVVELPIARPDNGGQSPEAGAMS